MGKLLYFRGVPTLELDRAKCTGCGMCIIVCPNGVFEIFGMKAAVVNRDACLERGACARNCPSAAITVRVAVGYAPAVINCMLGRKKTVCCCSIDQYETAGRTDSRSPFSGCCQAVTRSHAGS